MITGWLLKSLKCCIFITFVSFCIGVLVVMMHILFYKSKWTFLNFNISWSFKYHLVLFISFNLLPTWMTLCRVIFSFYMKLLVLIMHHQTWTLKKASSFYFILSTIWHMWYIFPWPIRDHMIFERFINAVNYWLNV